MLLLPEIVLMFTALTIFLLDLFIQKEENRKLLFSGALFGILLSALALCVIPESGYHFEGRFVMDPVIWWFKLIFLIAAFMVVGICGDFKRDVGEFLLVFLLSLVGMLFLVSAQDMVTLYVSLELTTMPLFALTAWKGCRVSKEAGLKYLMYGALASVFMLYGLTLLYGLTGETSLVNLAGALSFSPALVLASALIVAGLGFKLTLVPFHMWAPDVYEGAPTVVTAYLSTASKMVGVVLFFQLYSRILVHHVPHSDLLIAVLSVVTMTLGNLVAIVQNNIKRFMAFSAISQAGYILMGFLGSTGNGQRAVLFYLLVYVITNLVAFGVVIFVEQHLKKIRISDYRGLSKTHPLLALTMMLSLFSLAGIPPLSGFVGKFFLFSVASEQGYHWLVFAAAVNSTISLYYYLRVVRQMYIGAPEGVANAADAADRGMGLSAKLTLSLATLAMIALGVVPYFFNQIPN